MIGVFVPLSSPSLKVNLAEDFVVRSPFPSAMLLDGITYEKLQLAPSSIDRWLPSTRLQLYSGGPGFRFTQPLRFIIRLLALSEEGALWSHGGDCGLWC